MARLVLVAPADVLDGKLENKPVYAAIAAGLPAPEHDAFRARLAGFLDPRPLAGLRESEAARRVDWFGWAWLTASERPCPRPDAYPQMVWAGGLAVAGTFVSLEARENLPPRLETEALLLHGPRDLQPEVRTRTYVDALADAELVTVEGATHFFEERGTEVARHVEAFLDADRAPGRGAGIFSGQR